MMKIIWISWYMRKEDILRRIGTIMKYEERRLGESNSHRPYKRQEKQKLAASNQLDKFVQNG